MEVKASLNNLRMSPQKVRLVADVVRGMGADKALDQLKFMKKHAKTPIAKLVGSAVANAVHNFDLSKSNLFIKEIKVDEGPTLKRWMPRAHGRATTIRKRSSHITLTLGEFIDTGTREGKKQVIEKPVSFPGKPKEEKPSETVKSEDAPVAKEKAKEKGKEIIDPRAEGKGKHQKIEGKAEKGIVGRMFRRKSG